MNFPAVALSLAAVTPLRTAAALRQAPTIRLARSVAASVPSPAASSSFARSVGRHNNHIRRRDFHRGSAPRQSNANDDSMDSDGAIYWNRETSTPGGSLDSPIVREARILALSDPNDSYNEPLYNGPLPKGAELLKVGTSITDFDDEAIAKRNPNVIFVSDPNAREPLVQLLRKFPSVEWVHTRSAGIDFVASEGLFRWEGKLTNAKGMFSSTLAEYCMLACSYFAKDLPRLMRQKGEGRWEQYPVLELRGATLGVVGYGDIGRASAKLAKAYGMRVLGLKRNAAGFGDEHCDEVYGTEGLGELVAESDYVLISTPLTEQTRGMISAEVIAKCKPTAVIVNVGRGAIIDEDALIDALSNKTIKGAGLDVMVREPLPGDSPLWKLDNVLLSPHNMDMTLTFMRESTEFFVTENLPRFIGGRRLLNPVDKGAGY